MAPSKHQEMKKVFPEEDLVDLSVHPDRIAETFTGKTVFITGATGFVGRALVEKILHNTEVKKIYILIKNKRGETTQERFVKYFKDYIFEPLIKDRPESPQKVEVIPGDLTQDALGISLEDRQKLINEVQIMYHSGASVRFDEFLSKMVLLNVRGTRNMVNLAKEVKNLELFVHVSTTYCQPRDVVLEETRSIPPCDPHEMIKMVENLDDKTLNVLTSKLIGAYGNTYTWSKALAEAIVFEQQDKLPIMVVRPSIILSCWKYPIPGYTDSENGPMAAWILQFKGLLHVSHLSTTNELEYIPLDLVINTLLITTYNYINNTEKKVQVCNATCFSLNMVFYHDLGAEVCGVTPLDPGLGHPWNIFTLCPFIYYFILIFTQLLPAILIDGLARIFGMKMKRSLLEVQRKMMRSFEVLSFYSGSTKWCFKNDTIRTLRMDLNEREDETYPLNFDELDWLRYASDMFVSIRKLVVKEKIEDIPKALSTLKKFKIVHYVLLSCLIVFALRFTYTTILPLGVQFLYSRFDF